MKTNYSTWSRTLIFQKVFLFASMKPQIQMMKNYFYFIFLFSRKFKFLSWLFSYVEKNGLIWNIRLISNKLSHNLVKKQLQYTYFPISHEVKGNQIMKFGQLKENHKKNILLQKSCRKWGRETISRPLFVLKKLSKR